MKELQDIARLSDRFISVELVDESLFDWNVKLHQVDKDSVLWQDMKETNTEFILLNLTFPDNFPFSPPFMRVLSPRLENGYVLDGGAICMELLTPRGWSSAYTVEAVMRQFAASLVKGQVRRAGPRGGRGRGAPGGPLQTRLRRGDAPGASGRVPERLPPPTAVPPGLGSARVVARARAPCLGDSSLTVRRSPGPPPPFSSVPWAPEPSPSSLAPHPSSRCPFWPSPPPILLSLASFALHHLLPSPAPLSLSSFPAPLSLPLCSPLPSSLPPHLLRPISDPHNLLRVELDMYLRV